MSWPPIWWSRWLSHAETCASPLSIVKRRSKVDRWLTRKDWRSLATPICKRNDVEWLCMQDTICREEIRMWSPRLHSSLPLLVNHLYSRYVCWWFTWSRHVSLHRLRIPDSFGACNKLTASARWVMRSFLSFAFLRPAKAILVPGMYWLSALFGVNGSGYGGSRWRWDLDVVWDRRWTCTVIRPRRGDKGSTTRSRST